MIGDPPTIIAIPFALLTLVLLFKKQTDAISVVLGFLVHPATT
jgi:hypothetical protein